MLFKQLTKMIYVENIPGKMCILLKIDLLNVDKLQNNDISLMHPYCVLGHGGLMSLLNISFLPN